MMEGATRALRTSPRLMTRVHKLLSRKTAVLALLASAITHQAADARTLQQILNVGDLRIGVVLAAPWVLRNDDGELEGFEIDVARRLTADLGVEAEFVVYRFDALVAAVESGEIDIVISGLTITPERARHVNFSSPYATGGVALATNVSATADVERFEDLGSPEFRIGVVEDSVAATLAEGMLGDAEIVEFADAPAAAEALVVGAVDAYLDEQPAPTFLALEYPGLIDVPLARPLLETRAAFAVAKGDADFLAYLNAWIEAREADTWLPATHAFWFETLRWRDR